MSFDALIMGSSGIGGREEEDENGDENGDGNENGKGRGATKSLSLLY